MEKEDELMTSLRQQNACLEAHTLFLTQVAAHMMSCDSHMTLHSRL